MTNFKQLNIERPIDDGEALTDDDLYWRPLSNSHPTTLREYGPVTTIDIAPVRQQWISITDSTRVQIYSSDTLSLVRSFYSFKDTAYCGSFRSGEFVSIRSCPMHEHMDMTFRWSSRLCRIEGRHRSRVRFRNANSIASLQGTSRIARSLCAVFT
jgi:hypothetical protein